MYKRFSLQRNGSTCVDRVTFKEAVNLLNCLYPEHRDSIHFEMVFFREWEAPDGAIFSIK